MGTFMLAFSMLITNHSALAAPITDFDAGNIISNEVFYNKDAMSVSQIQTFLDNLIPNCDINGTQPSGYGNLTNAQYAQQIQGWPGPPYVCINKYYENPNTGETSYEKGGGAFDGGISAAQIIYNSAQQYNINPRVLLVMLKKESAGPLTADNWPLKSQYKYSMGYACPDSGPNYSANCDSSRAGFYKQMMAAAWQLNYYKEHPNDYRYFIGWNDIQYSPDPSCGTKRVYIQNIATLSLYIYTPYTPNDAALAAYPGQAYCGAYGNRNFFQYFKEWFGVTSYNGKLIRSGAPGSGIYLVENGVKRAFDSVVAMYSHGYSWANVLTVSDSVMTNIPDGLVLGVNVAAYTGKLIRSSAPGSGIYLVDTSTRRPFDSADAFYSYGYDWSKVVTVSDVVFTDIPVGAPLGINLTSYNGKLVRSSAAGSGIYLVENGVKRAFDSADAMYSHRYSWTGVITVSNAVMNSLPTGSTIGINIAAYTGKLIKSSAPGSGIYLVDTSTRRPFDSADAFYSYGYDWSKVVTVSDLVLSGIPIGPSLGLR